MPKFKALPEDKKGNEKLRMHCALVFAQMKMASFFDTYNIKPGDEVPQDKIIKLRGRVEDASDLAYQWTALIVMAQLSGRKGFSAKNIEVINTGDLLGEPKKGVFFDPKSQLKKKLFGYDYSSFDSKSLYATLFMPFVKQSGLTYSEEDRFQTFGEQVPEEDDLRFKVQWHMSNYMMHNFFAIDVKRKAIQYLASSDELTRQLHHMGFKKLAHMVGNIDKEQFIEMDFSSMKLNEFGSGVGLILKLSKGMSTLILNSNSLNN